MQKFLVVVLFSVLTACGGTKPVGMTQAEQPIVERIERIRELRTALAACWPGFDAQEYDSPLLYYTDSVCYAVDPSQQFQDKFGARLACRIAGIEIYKAMLPDSLPFHMETQVNFGDSTAYNGKTPYLFCSSPELTRKTIPDVTSDSLWLPMVLHEYMHGFQFRQPGFAEAFARKVISTPEGELAKLHKTNDWFDRAIAAENKTLLTALETADTAVRDSCIRTFLSLRADRKQQMASEMGDSTVRTEEIYELMEGGARFVEAHMGHSLGVYSDADTWLYDTDVSGYFFATGYNLMRLMDKCGVDKSRFYTDSIRPLETFLTTTISH